jgi:hypothetical protein
MWNQLSSALPVSLIEGAGAGASACIPPDFLPDIDGSTLFELAFFDKWFFPFLPVSFVSPGDKSCIKVLDERYLLVSLGLT